MDTNFLQRLANIEPLGKSVLRFGIVVVFIWIGALKFFTYEADGITPFVANSPFMSFFYNTPDQYKEHINKEGEFISENHNWHIANNTYGFSRGLGLFLIVTGLLVAVNRWAPLLSMFGSILIFLMTIGTLSFLVTTPESWVPHLGDSEWGFPYLSARGRLVVKDIVILGGSLITISQSAQLYIEQKRKNK